MNVESIEDLKLKPLGNILSSVTGTESFSFGMFVDGEILPKHPSKFLDDDFVPFSVMSGYSRDDGYLFALEKIPTLRRSGVIFKLDEKNMKEMIDFNMMNHNSDRNDLVKDMIFNKY